MPVHISHTVGLHPSEWERVCASAFACECVYAFVPAYTNYDGAVPFRLCVYVSAGKLNWKACVLQHKWMTNIWSNLGILTATLAATITKLIHAIWLTVFVSRIYWRRNKKREKTKLSNKMHHFLISCWLRFFFNFIAINSHIIFPCCSFSFFLSHCDCKLF